MKVVKDRSGHRVAAGILAAGTAGLAGLRAGGDHLRADDPLLCLRVSADFSQLPFH